MHLTQANTLSSASFLEAISSTKQVAASIAEEAQDKVMKVHANEPTMERAEDIGMLTTGDNTTASEFNDIEHQPGPEKSALSEAHSQPTSPETTQGRWGDSTCEMCAIVIEYLNFTCGSRGHIQTVTSALIEGRWKCDTCDALNREHSRRCLVCRKDEAQPVLGLPSDSWECPDCMTKHNKRSRVCHVCIGVVTRGAGWDSRIPRR